jgi:hypothetical protein
MATVCSPAVAAVRRIALVVDYSGVDFATAMA